jgi:hypothetical protein
VPTAAVVPGFVAVNEVEADGLAVVTGGVEAGVETTVLAGKGETRGVVKAALVVGEVRIKVVLVRVPPGPHAVSASMSIPAKVRRIGV